MQPFQTAAWRRRSCTTSSDALSINLNELKEISNGEESPRHLETLTKTMSEHLTSKYEVEFVYLRERDEAMIDMGKRLKI